MISKIASVSFRIAILEVCVTKVSSTYIEKLSQLGHQITNKNIGLV